FPLQAAFAKPKATFEIVDESASLVGISPLHEFSRQIHVIGVFEPSDPLVKVSTPYARNEPNAESGDREHRRRDRPSDRRPPSDRLQDALGHRRAAREDG